MSQKEQITFKGINLTPYADSSPDGQMAACAGLELYNGALRPISLNGTESRWSSADGNKYKLLHIHATTTYSHFIFVHTDTGVVYWATEGASPVNPILASVDAPAFTQVQGATSVGNTLVLFTAEGIQYMLFKNSEYHYIGSKPPEISLSFGLSGQWLDTMYSESPEEFVADDYTKEYITDPAKQINFTTKEDHRKEIAEKVYSAMNKAVEQCYAMGRFCNPFFVRAAYRRYDGSYTQLTPPVLMIPDSTGPKAVAKDVTYVYDVDGDGTLEGFRARMYGRVFAGVLNARLLQAPVLLQEWEDIIEGVDIFVTPMFNMQEEQSETVGVYGESIYDEQLQHWLGYIKPPQSFGVYSDDGGFTYGRQAYGWTDDWQNERNFIAKIKDYEDILGQLIGGVQFYKVFSLSMTDLKLQSTTARFPILVPDLQNLTLQESLPDSSDYQSHDTLMASHGFVYNKRLNLYNIKRLPFSGFIPEVMWPYTNDGIPAEWDIYVYLNSGDGINRVVKAASLTGELSDIGQFLYYPDTDAYRMVVARRDGAEVYSFQLSPHPFLNGSFNLWWTEIPAPTQGLVPADYNAPISLPNKLYTSEVDNPYYFPLEGIYTIGVGEILGLSSISTALSQGQFGQFPLLLFCTDGNYAMSVDGEGYYAAVHPVQRDVCISAQSITQTDREVLFLAARGLMGTDGTSAHCLTEVLDGVPEPIPAELKQHADAPDGVPHDMLLESLIAYDYSGRRLIVLSTKTDSAYIHTITDGTWSTAQLGRVSTVINVYPYAYIQFAADGHIIRLDGSYRFDATQHTGMIYTRPVKLNTYQLKRLHQIAVQGLYSQQQTITVYGSNDGSTWHTLGTSTAARLGALRGRPFKYYRFGLCVSLAQNENITGIHIDYDVLPETRLR